MRESSASWSDQELIERMRRDEPLAFHELFWRFQPLLVRYAKQLGVQPALREETVVEMLNDVSLTLMRYHTPVPRSLVAYLVTALRHRVAASVRARIASVDWRPEFDRGADNPRGFGDSSSEATRRASSGQWADPAVLSPALERLASSLDEGLSDEERMILDWVAHWVPQRLIAEWIGMSHGALRIRVLRLRERLREAAVLYAAQLSPAERLELRDFFRRTAMIRCTEAGGTLAAKALDRPKRPFARAPGPSDPREEGE
jgi:DNA-directed RNA polymerase specialized sigma24 family protein